MPFNWENTKLKYFLEFNPKETISKGAIAKKIAMEALIPYCRNVEKFEYAEYNGGTKFRNGDTIMARITPCLENGKTSRVSILEKNEIGFGSTEYIVFRAKENISDANFVYYLIRSNLVREPAIKSMVGSSGRQRVQVNVLEELVLSLPPLDIQKKIAGVLGVLDDKIELNNKINNNLEQQAQSLILEFIQHTDQEVPLGDLITFTNGFAFKSTDYLISGKYKIITIKNVQDGKVDSQGAPQLDELPYRLSNDCCLSVGDVLLSLTGNVGRVGIVTEENLLLNQRVAKLNAKETVFLPFLYFYMRLPSMKTEMENISKGTAQQNLSPVETLKLKIPFEKEKILLLSKTLSSFFDQIVYNFIQNQKLSALRDALLPKLMSGEIDVSNVDISELSSADKLSFSEE